MSRLTEILARKRDGLCLDEMDIADFIRAVCDGSASDAQVAAFCMATVIQGMDNRETVALTRSMAESGDCLDWTDLPGPVVDKHSSGGIGDKVSLILAPVMAACGAYVPMISGRGLGHTGGTLDKLESFQGYQVNAEYARMRSAVKQAGCAIVGATANFAPADKRIYAIRDLTATVESTALITASILSKKLAAAPQYLVMDVKAGSGAFCRTLEEAQTLAASIVRTAQGAGIRCHALVSDMNQCLGRNAGNALEAGEALAMLRGDRADDRLAALVYELAAELLMIAGMEADREKALQKAHEAIVSGQAYERFERMAVCLGADGLRLPGPAPVIRDIPVPVAGLVQAIDARALGEAIIELGGGRKRAGDAIDHRVGFSGLLGVGEAAQDALGQVHARSDSDAEAAIWRVQIAYSVGAKAMPAELIRSRIEA